MAAPVDYEATIKPLLKQRCASCHGALKQEADLRLDAGALIPPEIRSEILNRVASNDESERMPPEGPRLTAEQIVALREWIAADAPFPKNEVVPTKPAEHWSFQPVKRSPLPTSKHEHPIDAFLFGQRNAPPRATAEALLRRVHLDLIGLPPTIAEQDAFATEGKLESVIDGLLARPEYGERWARHWLDVARYADSNGYERDAEKPFVWRYRDYVIEALNNDKPFNRFIVEQIAGDELPDASVETNIAAGFLRLGAWDDQPGDPAADRYDQLDDVVSTNGHNDCITNHKTHAAETDKPIGALIADLKRSGLWNETLLVWGGEFGRTPTSEGVGKPGRDHDWHGYSMWLAGAGVKGGQAIGATDDLGFKAVEDRCHVSDLHATLLHLMGLDHTRLSYQHLGLDQRLTGVEERHIVTKALA